MEKYGKRVRLFYGIALGVMTVLLGALLIGFTLEIYVGGKDAASIFTREIVSSRLSKIAPALWIWAVMIVIGFVLWEVFPAPKTRIKPDARYTLHRLKKRTPACVEGDLKASFNAVKREELIVKILWLSALALGVALSIYAVVYLATPANFPPAENKSIPVLNMVKHIMPCVAAMFAVCLGIAVYEGVSAKKQLREVAKLTAGVKEVPEKPDRVRRKLEEKAESKKFFAGLLKVYDFVIKHRLLIIRVAVGCVAAAFVIAGVCNGSMRDVLVKAIKICTECIGLG